MLIPIPNIELSFDAIFTLVLAVALLIQLIYLFGFYARLLFHKKKDASSSLPPVSVIICARNEEDNLFQNLPKVMAQDYPNFEVVVVNHQSIDDSIHILKAYKRQYKNLKVIDIEKNKHLKNSKKLPLTIGIKGASHEILLLTDADCTPESNQWIKEMVANFGNDKQIVLGYGPYQKMKGFLNKVIRFDTTQIGINYFSFAKNGLAYMGIGRNLAYKKSMFLENKGFKSHYDLQSGDDDLFIQEVAKKSNYTIEFSQDSTVVSEPKKTWTSWFQQKQRHYTTAPRYRVIHKVLLGTYSLSMLLMLISFAFLVVETEFWMLACIGFGIRFVLNWLIQGLLFAKLRQKDLIIWIPFIEIFHFMLMPFIYFSKQSNKRWK